jgi:hypothetical protein
MKFLCWLLGHRFVFIEHQRWRVMRLDSPKRGMFEYSTMRTGVTVCARCGVPEPDFSVL